MRDTVRKGRLEETAKLVRDALLAHNQGEFAQAAALAERAKADAPRSGRIRELLGLSLYRTEKWRDALRELQTYRRITGRKDQNHVIADCYRAIDRPDKALEITGEVSRPDVDPEVWSEAVIVAASVFADQGQLDKALAHLARADLEPKKVEEYHLRLWYVKGDLLERLGRQREAREVWERIFSEDPQFFDVADRLR